MALRWKHGDTWVTLGFFLVTLTGHWVAASFFHADEQAQHGQPFEWRGYFTETAKDTLENWQSTSMQPISGRRPRVPAARRLPQSNEGDDRKEAKLDLLLEKATARGRPTR